MGSLTVVAGIIREVEEIFLFKIEVRRGFGMELTHNAPQFSWVAAFEGKIRLITCERHCLSIYLSINQICTHLNSSR